MDAEDLDRLRAAAVADDGGFLPHTHEDGPTEGLYQTSKPDASDFQNENGEDLADEQGVFWKQPEDTDASFDITISQDDAEHHRHQDGTMAKGSASECEQDDAEDYPKGEGPIVGTDYPITQQSTGKPANRQQRRAAERRRAKAINRAVERCRPQVVDGEVIGEEKLGLEKKNPDGKTIDDIFAEAEDVTKLMWMLVGAASMAWEHVDKAGVFDEAYATKIAASAEGRLIEIMRDMIKAGVMEALHRMKDVAEKEANND